MLTLPKVNLQVTSAAAVPQLAEQKILFVGQKFQNGTAIDKALTEDIAQGEEDALFGAYSILAQMIRRARSFNQVNRFDAIALSDNAAGIAATGSIALSGTSTEAKDFKIQIGNEGFEYSATIASGTSATDTAAAIADAITASSYPFSATSEAGTITVTYDHKGTAGNEILIKIKQGVAGLTSVITNFSGGAGAVDTAGIFDNLAERYQAIVYSQDLDLAELTNFTEGRFNTDNVILDGVGILTSTGAYATVKSTVEALNLKTLVNFANVDEMRYFELSTNISAEFAAKRALRLTEGSSIVELVVDYQEGIGGIQTASLPYFNTPMSLPKPTGRLTQVQIDDAVEAGLSLVLINEAGGIITGDIPTTYKTNNTGTNDPGFKYLNYVDTISSVREYLFRHIKNKYGQTRATAGDLIPGRSMSNVASVKAFAVEKYKELANKTLLMAGDEASRFFEENFNITLDASTGVYTFDCLAPLVVQARGFNGIVAITFEI
jgi:phage tail sheath gpL-like